MNLITDRTYADVLAKNAKGVYTVNDLNRVESAVAQLQTRLPELDIHPNLTVKVNWTPVDTFSAQEWITAGQMQRYLGNVRTLCSLCGVAHDLPQTMDGLTWEGANAIETALSDIQNYITNIKNNYRYSGEILAGEENIL